MEITVDPSESVVVIVVRITVLEGVVFGGVYVPVLVVVTTEPCELVVVYVVTMGIPVGEDGRVEVLVVV